MTFRLSLLLCAFMLTACTNKSQTDIDTTINILKTLSMDDMEGRKTGTMGGLKARSYIMTQAEETKAFNSVTLQGFTFVTKNGDTVKGANILAKIDTADDDTGPLLIITAHYDHVGMVDGEIYNGADDNASGAATLFSIAQSFKITPPQHDVLLVWFDAEELGLKGAEHFVEAAGDFGGRAVMNMNLDMVGRNESYELFVSGTYHTPAVKDIILDASVGTDIDLQFGHDRPEDGHDDWTMQSDHALFHKVGLPFIYIGVEDHAQYHQPDDEFETLPLDFYKQSVQTIVAIARRLDDNLPRIARKTPDAAHPDNAN